MGRRSFNSEQQIHRHSLRNTVMAGAAASPDRAPIVEWNAASIMDGSGNVDKVFREN
jgi:hypothetical protein